MIFLITLGAIYSTLCLISGIAQYLVHNNLLLLLGCQLLIFLMEYATAEGAFFQSPRSQMVSLFEVPDSVLKHLLFLIFFRLARVFFYLESLSDCVRKVHVVIV